MIKLAFAAIVFGLFVLIFVGKKLASGAKEAWTKANALADAKLEGKQIMNPRALPRASSGTQAQDQAFDNFMEAQSMLLNLDGMGPYLESEIEKQLYVNFVAGAADRMSRTISDPEDSERWFLLSAHSYASKACGDREAADILEAYGRSGDARLDAAGKAGWESMETMLDTASGKVTEEQFKLMMMTLYAVVKQKELPAA